MEAVTPAEVIAGVLRHVEGEGIGYAEAAALAGDVLRALAVRGMVVVDRAELSQTIDEAETFRHDCGGDAEDEARLERLRAVVAAAVVSEDERALQQDRERSVFLETLRAAIDKTLAGPVYSPALLTEPIRWMSPAEWARHSGPPEPRPAPLLLAKAVQTCSACPSEWSAWTTAGQYLYLRYRSGIGTVDAYPGPDPSTWADVPNGLLARFGEPGMDGDIALEDFLAASGLELAPGAEISSVVRVPMGEWRHARDPQGRVVWVTFGDGGVLGGVELL
ncbi:hypothetical protein [Streptosporangium sp. NPDC002524]|uniref:hypothetical protein n=1 Tax=Streptosporangium sp. NPDC002524 TaxID=3154537 RepID=UPI0033339D1F